MLKPKYLLPIMIAHMLGLFAILSAAAQADSSQVEFLPSLNQNLCLDVYGSSTDDGAGVTQWQCHDGANEIFSLNSLGDNRYNLVASQSGKCLQIRNASKDVGASVNQKTCDGSEGQVFELIGSGSSAKIRNANSGMCLALGSQSNGVAPVQEPCKDIAKQIFIVRAAPAQDSASSDQPAPAPAAPVAAPVAPPAPVGPSHDQIQAEIRALYYRIDALAMPLGAHNDSRDVACSQGDELIRMVHQLLSLASEAPAQNDLSYAQDCLLSNMDQMEQLCRTSYDNSGKFDGTIEGEAHSIDVCVASYNINY